VGPFHLGDAKREVRPFLWLQDVSGEDNSANILQADSEPVALEVDLLTEKSSVSLENEHQSTVSSPPLSAVENPAPNPAAEQEPSLIVSEPTPAEAGNGVTEQPEDVTMVENSSPAVETQQQAAAPHQPVITTPAGGRQTSGVLLLDIKRQRAQKRQQQQMRRFPGANGPVLHPTDTNGAVGGDNVNHYPPTDNVTYIGTHHKRTNTYNIAASDDREKCCVVM